MRLACYSPWCIVCTLNLWQGLLHRGVELWIDVCSKKSPSKALYVDKPANYDWDGKILRYELSIIVNSKIRFNTVVNDIVVSYSYFAETLFL